MKQSVWFVILTYRPKVTELVSHLRTFDGLSFILVDNSEDRNEFPKGIPVLRTGTNLGYTGGMNRGISYCLSHGAEWVVVTNEDIDITEKELKKFIMKLTTTKPGVVGPSIGALDKKRWTTILGKGVDYISGSFMAIHRDVIFKVGMFYESYFIYYEDVELSLRAHRTDFKVTHIPMKLTHQDGTTFGPNSFLHQYYLARNHLLFVERNAPGFVKIHELLRLPKTIWEHWKKGERGALVGIRDYFLRRFGQYKPL